MSENKEPSFFSDDEVFARGENWYRQTFADAQPSQLCGEASTSYSRFEEYRIGVSPPEWVSYLRAPERIASANPNVKLIYVLRHPVDRAYSHYGFMMQYEPLISFEEALVRHKTIVETSKYIDHIKRYLDVFSREQMLFIILDDFEQDPEKELSRVQRFLGIEVVELGKQSMRSNPSGAGYSSHRINAWMARFRRSLLSRSLARLTPASARRKIVSNVSEALNDSFVAKHMALKHREKLPGFADETRTQLVDALDESTRELEAFLSRDLSAWRL